MIGAPLGAPSRTEARSRTGCPVRRDARSVMPARTSLTRGWDLAPPVERPRFDILVVAGDLIPRAERGVRWLLERVPDNPRQPCLLRKVGERLRTGKSTGWNLLIDCGMER